jgi:hypothetical protein
MIPWAKIIGAGVKEYAMKDEGSKKSTGPVC